MSDDQLALALAQELNEHLRLRAAEIAGPVYAVIVHS